MTRRAPVAIVGAGPGGMAAAVELARRGVDCCVVDEGARPGGQIFRQVPPGFRVDHALEAPSHHEGERLLAAFGEARVTGLHGVTVWDAAPGRLALARDGRAEELRAERILLAPGAHDRVMAFPGWDLPGVITAGAAQVMVRGFQVAPGRRALVAGSGPLLLPTVTSLLAAGVEVVAALEATGRLRMLRALGGVLTHAGRLREAWFYARALLRRGVALRTGWTVFAAHGDGAVEGATIGRVDRHGRPRPETARLIDVDVVCTGFGLVPAVELAGLLGCRTDWNPRRGGWVTACDDTMKTTVDGVFVAGEIAGIGGAQVAMAEGRLAGLAIARSLGADVDEAGVRTARRQRARERRAADAMLSAFPELPGLADLVTPDTVVCRCEDVTRAGVEDAARVHGTTLRAVKMGCRVGMGPCQGRICHPIVHAVIPDGPGREPHPPRPVPQVPARPVDLGTLATAGEGADGSAGPGEGSDHGETR